MDYLFVTLFYCYGILSIWGKWKIFERMGIMGFWSIVPIYSDYLIYQKVWRNGRYGVVVSLMFYYGILMLSKTFYSWFDWITAMIGIIGFGFICNAVTMNRLSKIFKAPQVIQLGMTFLWPVFMILMAGDKTLTYHPELAVELSEYLRSDKRQH